MGFELIYTSAPQGLKAGSRGFCTVAFTEGMPANCVQLCEGLSAYEHVFAPHDPNYGSNPVSFSHYRFSLAGQQLSILSRIGACGADYSGRTNKLAHYLVLKPGELTEGGPAAVMSLPGAFRESWGDEPPHLLQVHRQFECESPAAFQANTWARCLGDAGWAGVLAQRFEREPEKPAFIVFRPEDRPDLLAMVREALALLPPERRWQVTFSTYFMNLPRGSECIWRCCLPQSDALKTARRLSGCLVLDLTGGPVPAAEEGPLVESARTGAPPPWARPPEPEPVATEVAIGTPEALPSQSQVPAKPIPLRDYVKRKQAEAGLTPALTPPPTAKAGPGRRAQPDARTPQRPVRPLAVPAPLPRSQGKGKLLLAVFTAVAVLIMLVAAGVYFLRKNSLVPDANKNAATALQKEQENPPINEARADLQQKQTKGERAVNDQGTQNPTPAPQPTVAANAPDTKTPLPTAATPGAPSSAPLTAVEGPTKPVDQEKPPQPAPTQVGFQRRDGASGDATGSKEKGAEAGAKIMQLAVVPPPKEEPPHAEPPHREPYTLRFVDVFLVPVGKVADFVFLSESGRAMDVKEMDTSSLRMDNYEPLRSNDGAYKIAVNPAEETRQRPWRFICTRRGDQMVVLDVTGQSATSVSCDEIIYNSGDKSYALRISGDKLFAQGWVKGLTEGRQTVSGVARCDRSKLPSVVKLDAPTARDESVLVFRVGNYSELEKKARDAQEADVRRIDAKYHLDDLRKLGENLDKFIKRQEAIDRNRGAAKKPKGRTLPDSTKWADPDEAPLKDEVSKCIRDTVSQWSPKDKITFLRDLDVPLSGPPQPEQDRLVHEFLDLVRKRNRKSFEKALEGRVQQAQVEHERATSKSQPSPEQDLQGTASIEVTVGAKTKKLQFIKVQPKP